MKKERKKRTGFRNNSPGRDWIRNFINRHPNISLRKRVSLDQYRQQSMNPENLVKHFCRLRPDMKRFDIMDPTRIFNLDESGFSVKGMTLGRSKFFVPKGRRGNSIESKFRGSCDHVTMMPVISAAGQILTPLFVLPRVEERYRKRSDGKWELPTHFLPQPKLVYMNPVAGVDSNIFFSWAKQFVDETKFLRRENKKILLIMDGYACHITYKTLSLLRDNGIVVFGLPAHKSHVLQPLDVGFFGPLKEKLEQLLINRSITSKNETRSDIFTISELLRDAYHLTVNSSNSIAGFAKTGIWNSGMRECDPSVIKESKLTSGSVNSNTIEQLNQTRSLVSIFENSQDSSPLQRIDNYRKLCELFKSRAKELCSEGLVSESGTIKVSTTSGAMLKSENVINSLEAREKAKRDAEALKVQRQKGREERAAQARRDAKSAKIQKENEHQERAAQKEKDSLELDVRKRAQH